MLCFAFWFVVKLQCYTRENKACLITPTLKSAEKFDRSTL